jgi:hypothetical protein
VISASGDLENSPEIYLTILARRTGRLGKAIVPLAMKNDLTE